MGLFPMDCASCKKPFMWFSGNLVQICGDCMIIPKENKGAVKMTKKELEAKLIELEKKVAVLEARPQYCMGHYCHCTNHNYPTYPNYPYYPYYDGIHQLGNTSGGSLPPNSITIS